MGYQIMAKSSEVTLVGKQTVDVKACVGKACYDKLKLYVHFKKDETAPV